MISFSLALKNALLGTAAGDDLAALLTGVAAGSAAGTGYMYIRLFGGAVPVNADAALSGHTILGKISSNAGGATGCSLAIASGGVIGKNASETWSAGTLAFTGAGVTGGVDTIPATYFRVTANTDDGTGVGGTNPRIQGTVGTIGFGQFDMMLGNASLTEGNTFTLSGFQINCAN